MKGAKKQAIITETDIQQALRKFQESGGLVHRLPDEVTPRSRKVGMHYAVYEDVLEGFSYDAGTEGSAGNA